MGDPNADLREQDVASGTPGRDQAAAGPLPGAGGSARETAGGESEGERLGPVVRDRRRLDPKTGKVREAYAAGGSLGVPSSEPLASGVSSSGSAPASGEAPGREEELLHDLQRLQAEYVNYRRRVERDRNLARDLAVAGVLDALLPVLDDIHLARQHGDLEEGPFAAIAEKLETALGRFGLERYGAVGEAFDPTVHEALMHIQAELAEGTTEPTVVQVMQPGYRCGERLLRPARVAVADPT